MQTNVCDVFIHHHQNQLDCNPSGPSLFHLPSQIWNVLTWYYIIIFSHKYNVFCTWYVGATILSSSPERNSKKKNEEIPKGVGWHSSSSAIHNTARIYCISTANSIFFSFTWVNWKQTHTILMIIFTETPLSITLITYIIASMYLCVSMRAQGDQLFSWLFRRD